MAWTSPSALSPKLLDGASFAAGGAFAAGVAPSPSSSTAALASASSVATSVFNFATASARLSVGVPSSAARTTASSDRGVSFTSDVGSSSNASKSSLISSDIFFVLRERPSL